MAAGTLATKGSVIAGNGLGPVTYIFAVTTGTISMADAITEATTNFGLTVAGVSGTSGTAYLAAQGGNLNDASPAVGLESVSGIALTATFTD